MITISNYDQQKNSIDWKTMPKSIQDNKQDVESIMEFYNDDADIKDTVDLFFKGINANSKPVGQIIIGKLPKIDFVEPKEKPAPKPKKETLQDAFLDAPLVRSLMPKLQQMAVLENDKSEEVQFFIDKIKELEAIFVDAKKIDQKTPLMDKIVKIHYFYGGSDWFIFDYDPKNKVFFGYVVLNGDTQMSEAGYISVDELMSIKRVELDFFWNQVPLGKALHSQYPSEFEEYNPTAKKVEEVKTTPAKKVTPKKEKIEKVIDKKVVDNYSVEYQLIRRFWNVIKNENGLLIPFRTIQLLYMAFNKAAVERKVRKTSSEADLFTKCNEKIKTIFEKFENPNQLPYNINFTDKKLYDYIKEYANGYVQNKAIPLLKRYIGMQNTLPVVKTAETLLKSINKIIDTDKDNRLIDELKKASKSLTNYLEKPKESLPVNVFGLSRPRSICTNRIKCSGIDKSGKLYKGYKFQEHTGNIIKVRPTTAKKRKEVKSNALYKAPIKSVTIKSMSLKKQQPVSKKKNLGLKNYLIGSNQAALFGANKIDTKKYPLSIVKKDFPLETKIKLNSNVASKNKFGTIVGHAYADRITNYDYPFEVIVLFDKETKPEPIKPFLFSIVKTKKPKPLKGVGIISNVIGNVIASSVLGEPAKNSIAAQMKQRANTKQEYYIIPDRDIANFLGKIEKKQKESVAITLTGGQGSMKTRLCFQLMNTLAQNYKVGHASIEEHPASTLYYDKVHQYLNNKAMHNVSAPEINSIDDVHKLCRENDVIVIDSFSKLQEMQRGCELDKDFRKRYDGKLFIIIYQLTSDGKMRGGSKSQFDGDIVGFIEKEPNYKNNYCYWNKNRYQDKNLEDLKFNIYSGKLQSNQQEPEPQNELEFSFNVK